MALAAIFGFYLASMGWGAAPVQSGTVAPSAPPAQTQPAKAPKPAVRVKPKKHNKKTVPPNCTNSPTPLITAVVNPADSAKSTAASTDAPANDPSSARADSTSVASKSAVPSAPASAQLPPCPPPRKVVRNGGSDEPSIQLIGGTNAEQAAHQRSTDQLTSATEENLKTAAGHELTPSQRETVSQIRQFLQESRTAVAAGDLERGHNLAQKAHLLSEELVKP